MLFADRHYRYVSFRRRALPNRARLGVRTPRDTPRRLRSRPEPNDSSRVQARVRLRLIQLADGGFAHPCVAEQSLPGSADAIVGQVPHTRLAREQTYRRSFPLFRKRTRRPIHGEPVQPEGLADPRPCQGGGFWQSRCRDTRTALSCTDHAVDAGADTFSNGLAER